MFRLKITPKHILDMANVVMSENKWPEPAYHQANGWACKLWFDERNSIADHVVHGAVFR